MLIKHTEEFDLAYRFVTETNENIFLTGKAGTGKTTFLKYLLSSSGKQTVVAAPTGVAAINARGVTLHSLFQLPFGIILPDMNSFQPEAGTYKNPGLLSKIHYNREKLNLLRSIELLVIDEVSMLSSFVLDAIDTILRYVRRNPHYPFGGVQLLLIGDLYQLPPVVRKEDWQILQSYYSSPFFFDSMVLRNNFPVIIELKEIFRQKDGKFIDILNGIRNNNIDEENFRLLNSRLKKSFLPQENDEYITLTTHNYQSDEINERKLSSLQSRTYSFTAEISGEFSENSYPAEKELKLKTGAQVMFLKNDTEGKQYFNGKIGTITKLTDSVIRVKCINDEHEIEVKKSEWQNISYKLDPEKNEITEEVLGSFIQYPLRLAWGITIHKSQGLTFDKVIVDAEKAFANGQVYVALSRCTTLEGLVLKSPVYKNFLGATADLKEWLQRNRETSLTQVFSESRQNYILRELQNIFTWSDWYFELKDFYGFLLENHSQPASVQRSILRKTEKIPAETIVWITSLLDKQKELYEIAEKFKQMISRLNKVNIPLEGNNHLQKRIKDGANYFFNEISRWQDQFCLHPLSVETKKIARKIDRYLDQISSILQVILLKISYCRNGFLFDEYSNKRKYLNQAEAKIIRSSYSKSKTSDLQEKDIPNPGLYKRLFEFREQIAAEFNSAPESFFSLKGIKNICTYLPINKNELAKIKGFGKAQTEIRGREVISLIKEYCRETNIDISNRIEIPAITIKPDTVMETVKYFKDGMNIKEIAETRNLVTGTIEGHLAQAIKRNLIQIDKIMPTDEAEKIAAHFPEDLSDIRLALIKEKMPPQITFGKLRIVLAWLEKEKR